MWVRNCNLERVDLDEVVHASGGECVGKCRLQCLMAPSQSPVHYYLFCFSLELEVLLYSFPIMHRCELWYIIFIFSIHLENIFSLQTTKQAKYGRALNTYSTIPVFELFLFRHMKDGWKLLCIKKIITNNENVMNKNVLTI